ncbi:MAG: hypothetical protein JKY13_00250, partial [Gammaproteobacteria bacterium]|nr:hypothetical protein [Gammaproteobacteria bacterium]
FESQQTFTEKFIEDKLKFLKEYPAMSAARSRAFNYKDSYDTWNTDNISGLKKRISNLLGIDDAQRRVLSYSNYEGFHILENILLRPGKGTTTILQFGQLDSDNDHFSTHTLCASKNHGLDVGEKIRILEPSAYAGEYSIALNAEGVIGLDEFEIVKIYVDPKEFSDTGVAEWDRYVKSDSYSITGISQAEYGDGNTTPITGYVTCVTTDLKELQVGDKITFFNINDESVFAKDYEISRIRTDVTAFDIKEVLTNLDLTANYYNWRYINDLFMSLSHDISLIEKIESEDVGYQSGDENYIICTTNYPLVKGDEIQIINTTLFDNNDQDKRDFYTVEKVEAIAASEYKFWVASSTSFEVGKTGQWIYRFHKDPFSFQLSFIFPDWPTRFQSPDFKSLVEQIIATEVPAHLTINIYWLDIKNMNAFEAIYNNWLRRLPYKETMASVVENAAYDLIRLLRMGEIPLPIVNDNRLGLGQMEVENDEQAENPQRDFQVAYPSVDGVMLPMILLKVLQIMQRRPMVWK